MCYIFEKHGIQGYRIWHSRVSNVKYTTTQIHKYKVLKTPIMCNIFEKYGIQGYEIWHSRVSNVLKRPNLCHILKSIGFKDTKYDIPVYQMENTQIQIASMTQHALYFWKAVLQYMSCWDWVGMKFKMVGMDPNSHPKPWPTNPQDSFCIINTSVPKWKFYYFPMMFMEEIYQM